MQIGDFSRGDGCDLPLVNRAVWTGSAHGRSALGLHDTLGPREHQNVCVEPCWTRHCRHSEEVNERSSLTGHFWGV